MGDQFTSQKHDLNFHRFQYTIAKNLHFPTQKMATFMLLMHICYSYLKYSKHTALQPGPTASFIMQKFIINASYVR